MQDIYNLFQSIYDIILAVWDFVKGIFEGIADAFKLYLQFLGHVDEVIESMPPVVSIFAVVTIGVIVLYFVIGLVTGGSS